MPRSKTRARLRAARPPVGPSTDPMDDDSGRTPARMDYLRREILTARPAMGLSLPLLRD